MNPTANSGVYRCPACSRCLAYAAFVRKNGQVRKSCNECAQKDKERRIAWEEQAAGAAALTCCRCKKTKPRADFLTKTGRVVKHCRRCLLEKDHAFGSNALVKRTPAEKSRREMNWDIHGADFGFAPEACKNEYWPVTRPDFRKVLNEL
ncbi:hypothetical protein [Neisseria perflava]|uniref:hypothetical protein n=1 Tax=Neisseria perflava TaxID=33053 RepID=UPI0020A178EB|nr:hypothetical protein [Neisseria perflava]MCP1659305.1 uncharacterized protein (DUF983 family) [Neisseria perflava]MCP1772892.1 uncharacterized protein (DUF983 family) [Neisseria perflava]